MKFKGVTALAGVDVKVRKGEVVGLIGPNGSGKTTLLNVVSGLFSPADGTIGVGSQTWPRMTLTGAAQLGIRRTFQNIRLFSSFTVLETVEVAAAWLAEGDRRGNALRALQELDFTHHSGRLAAELPYGLQRRLEIARAIAGRLEFLLLDEPSAGLNRGESADVVKVIQKIRERRGCGILVVDHDLHVIMNVCDRVIVFAEGRVIANGTPQEVRNDPAVINAYLGS